MADQNFREIQLSGKQLFFLFMASVVVAVGVFLLGVSVGRGVDVNAEGPVAEVARTAEVLPGGEVPGPTVITPSDKRYHENLQGTTTPPVESAPSASPSPSETLDGPEVIDEPVPAAPPPAAPAAAPAPVAPATQKPAPPVSTSTAKPPPAASSASRPAPAQAGGSWHVQVAAFRSRENADRQVRLLAARGYPASVSTGGGLFRVRVGPYGQRGDADRTAARLQTEEGLKPSVTR